MIKLIIKTRKALSNLASKPGELIEWLVLLVVAVGGLSIAAKEAWHAKPEESRIGEITLGLLGLLALHFCVERFTVMQRIDRGLKVIPAFLRKKMSPQMESEVHAFVESTGKLRDLMKHAEHHNPEFPKIVDSILTKHSVQLSELSVGKLNVSSEKTAIVNQELLSFYKMRFDAVSDDDLDYWAGESPDALAYFKVHKDFIKKHTTVVTRIFILPRKEIIEKVDLIKVLKEQHREQVGWGVVIREDLSEEIKKREKDFALYDRNKAVSIFKGRGPTRAFKTFFATDDNKREIDTYKMLYKELVSECRFVNQKFVDSYPGALEPNELEAVEENGKKNNRDWNVLLKQPDTIFPLIAGSLDEVETKVELLIKMILKT
jgi:hypothetical protein